MQATIHFAQNGTPFSRVSLKDMVQHFAENLPRESQKQLPFRNLRPGDRFIQIFVNRHPALSMKRRANLEKDRAVAMSPNNLAEHYARLRQVYKEFNITSGAQIFNLDESGFSTRTAFRARAKAAMETQGRNNSVEMKWSSNACHVTLMLVVSADGRVWAPLAILPGKRAKYRIRPDGTRETPACFLPECARITYRDPAGMDSAIFLEFVEWFIEQTTALRSRYRNLVLTMDGYGAHTSFKALKRLRDMNINVVALPAHTSHRTQTLDYSVFSPFKNYLRNSLNDRGLVAGSQQRNDIYTLCEIIHESYKKSVTNTNIVNGFKAWGVWCTVMQNAVPEVIQARDIVNIGGFGSRDEAFISYKSLVSSYVSTRNMLRTDGPVLVKGSLNTRGGALLTTQSVLNILQQREAGRALDQAERAALQVETAARRSLREQQAADRAHSRAEARRAHLSHAVWMTQRSVREMVRQQSRGYRRAIARQRALRLLEIQ